MYTESFPLKLKEARKMSNLTQEDVAKETGIPQRNITRYETGSRIPDIETIAILANFYDVSTDWLLGLGKQPGNKPNYDTTKPNEVKKIINQN